MVTFVSKPLNRTLVDGFVDFLMQPFFQQINIVVDQRAYNPVIYTVAMVKKLSLQGPFRSTANLISNFDLKVYSNKI